MEVIKNKRILALVGIAVLILGCILPYYTVSFFGYSQSIISLWGYWEGKIVFVLALANVLFVFQDSIEKYVPQLVNNWVGIIALIGHTIFYRKQNVRSVQTQPQIIPTKKNCSHCRNQVDAMLKLALCGKRNFRSGL